MNCWRESRIPIIFDSPYMNVFAARLTDGAERNDKPVRPEPCLLNKFAERSIVCRLAIENFAFRHRPGAVIFVPPVWAAGMCEQHFEPIAIPKQ